MDYERRLEFIVGEEAEFLCRTPDARWNDFLQQMGVKIVASLPTAQARSFVLSHSSLFVFTDRFILLTCGEVCLLKGLQFLKTELRCEAIGINLQYRCLKGGLAIDELDYEQMALAESFDGEMRLRTSADHFTMNLRWERMGSYIPSQPFRYVVLSEISEPVSRAFQGEAKHVAKDALKQILPGFSTQDYTFIPPGYSLNAVRGTEYYAIHLGFDSGEPIVTVELGISDLDQADFFTRQVANIFGARVQVIHDQVASSPVRRAVP